MEAPEPWIHLLLLPACRASGSGVTHQLLLRSVREYRRDRWHLYPLEECQAAVAAGGTAWPFCGIEVALLAGDLGPWADDATGLWRGLAITDP